MYMYVKIITLVIQGQINVLKIVHILIMEIQLEIEHVIYSVHKMVTMH